MSKLTMSKKKFAELANNLVQCGSVTFNEADDRDSFRRFKLFCGKISNFLTKRCADWNAEAEGNFKLSDDVLEDLKIFKEEYEVTDDLTGKKVRIAARKKLKEKYKVALAMEEQTIEKLNAFFDLEVEEELDNISMSDVPLNVNGAFMDTILPLLTEK